ncbi:hypothetical protein ACFX2C_005203 [Malus domestica]
MPSIPKALPVKHGGYWIRRFKHERAFPPRRVPPRTSVNGSLSEKTCSGIRLLATSSMRSKLVSVALWK